MQEEQEIDRREIDLKRFRIDTTVNLAHILTTVALVMSIISWGSDLRATVIKHDGEINDLKAANKDDRMIVREELREINRKIDKIVDRQTRQ